MLIMTNPETFRNYLKNVYEIYLKYKYEGSLPPCNPRTAVYSLNARLLAEYYSNSQINSPSQHLSTVLTYAGIAVYSEGFKKSIDSDLQAEYLKDNTQDPFLKDFIDLSGVSSNLDYTWEDWEEHFVRIKNTFETNSNQYSLEHALDYS